MCASIVPPYYDGKVHLCMNSTKTIWDQQNAKIGDNIF